MHPNLEEYLARFVPAPEEWFENVKSNGQVNTPVVPSIDCRDYGELLSKWKEALDWTDVLDISFTSMLSVVASTKLLHDQLWLRVFGRPGTGKTTLCEALACNLEHVLSLSKFKGFHSGFKEPGAGGEDTSLIPKMRDKTTIINEADVLLRLPNLNEVLSELRDLYSGVTRANYRNAKNNVYDGLRTSMIIAGTSTMRELNRSAAGDRFLDCIVHDTESNSVLSERVRGINLESVDSMLQEANGDASSRMSPKLYLAYQYTNGFINHLRKNAATGLQSVRQRISTQQLSTFNAQWEKLGNLVAIMRYRPASEEEPTEAEFHVRLTKQITKLAFCSAYVLDSGIDSEIMRRVAKVSKDTCYGDTFNISQLLLKHGELDVTGLAARTNSTTLKVKANLRILQAMGCVSTNLSSQASGALNSRRHTFKLSFYLRDLLTRLNGMLGE